MNLKNSGYHYLEDIFRIFYLIYLKSGKAHFWETTIDFFLI
jgi:hypothetical protein